MVAGPTQQSPAFDPVAAGALLRRARVAKIRATTTIESTTTAPQPRGTSGFKVTATFSEKSNGAARAEDANTAPQAQTPSQPEGIPNDQKPMNDGALQQNAPAPTMPTQQPAAPETNTHSQKSKGTAPSETTPTAAQNPPVSETPTTPPPSQENNHAQPHIAPPLEGNRIADAAPAQSAQDGTDKFPTVRPEESLEQARARELHKKNYQPAPPLQTPPSAAAGGGDDTATEQESAAADRQMDAANETDDYAAQARARGAARRAAAKKKNASQGDDAPIGTAERGASVLYSVLFQGAAAADQLCEDGGVTATFAGAGNLYQTLLTVFPSFDDKMRNSFGAWLPQKFDIMNTRKQEMLFHFGEFVKGIVAATEMLLYLLMILFIPILLAAIYAFVTNPLLGIQAYLSVF